VHFVHLDVASDATLVKYYAIVKLSALHHMRPATPQRRHSRGIPMTYIANRLFSAVVAVSISGALFSAALI
jgi:hypothetical protein